MGKICSNLTIQTPERCHCISKKTMANDFYKSRLTHHQGKNLLLFFTIHQPLLHGYSIVIDCKSYFSPKKTCDNYTIHSKTLTNYFYCDKHEKQLIQLMLLVSFYTLWKHQKTSLFLMFLGVIERNQQYVVKRQRPKTTINSKPEVIQIISQKLVFCRQGVHGNIFLKKMPLQKSCRLKLAKLRVFKSSVHEKR